jgi:hypothetical protein
MSITITDYRNIDINQIELKKPEKIKGSYYSFAQYKGNDIYIQTPMLTNLTNIVKLDTRCYIELDLDNSNEETNEFYEFLSNFDDNNILKIHKESTGWFNKEFPLDIVEEFYTSPLKHKNNPKLKLKVPVTKNKIDCSIYDKNNVSITNLNENNKVICLLKFSGLKFLSQQVISEWIPIQIKTNEIANQSNMEYLINDNFKNNIESTEPESAEPELNEPESTEPELTEPELTEPELTEPELTEPESTEPKISFIKISETQDETLDNELNEIEIDEIEFDEPESVENIDELKKELEKYKKLFETHENKINNIKNLII